MIITFTFYHGIGKIKKKSMGVINASIRAFLFFMALFSSVFAYAAEPINVAAIFAKTGVAGEANKGSIEGAELAISEINRQGGLLGRKLQLIVLG